MEKEYKNIVMEKKKERLKRLLGIIKSMCDKGEVSYRQVVSLAEYNFGVSQKVAKEYIRVHVNLGSIRIVEGKIEIVTKPHSLSDKKDNGKDD